MDYVRISKLKQCFIVTTADRVLPGALCRHSWIHSQKSLPAKNKEQWTRGLLRPQFIGFREEKRAGTQASIDEVRASG
jgi:hypothetical protein